MEKDKAYGTPMGPSTYLKIDVAGKEVDKKLYRRMIDFKKLYRRMIDLLLYLTASRPNIMFSICKCARFQVFPKESHLTTIKKII